MTPAHAQSANTDFCTQWFQQKKQFTADQLKSPGSALTIFLQALKIKFIPAAYSDPDFLLIKPETQIRSQVPLPTPVPIGRNLIFFVGAPPETMEKESKREAKNKLRENEKKVRPLVKSVLKLIKSEDLESCIVLENKTGFNYDDYLSLVDENGSLMDERQISNEDKALKYLKHALRRSRLNWETKDFTDLEDVYEALKDPSIENIVIVSHGQSNSLILDSRWNEYPRYFFNAITPHLRSLSFYSCFSQSVPEQYGLSDLFQKTPSLYSTRLITTVKKNTKVFEQGMAPLNGLSHYLRTLEQKIETLKNQENEDMHASSPQPEPDCSLRIRAPIVDSGTFGFFLNLKFIGSIGSTHLAEGTEEFHFPCSFIDREVNILTNRNINITVKTAEISGKPFEVISLVDPRGSKVTQVNHYQTADGSYQSSKWQIESTSGTK